MLFLQVNKPHYVSFLQVNKVDFNHFTREEAANYLLHIKHGEPVEICTQNKMHRKDHMMLKHHSLQ